MSARVRVEVRGRHARLTFDDGRMNLLSHEGLDAISEAFESIRRLLDRRIAEQGTVPAVVTMESGRPKLFAAGADMMEMRDFGPAEATEFSAKGQRLFRRIAEFPALTMVMIDGDCFGGALDFALSFDVRLATSRSRFSHPGGKIGIITGFGGTARWRSSLRPAAAGTLFLNNEIVSAERAMELGIVHEIDFDSRQAVRRLLTICEARKRLPQLKVLASERKNLASLALHAKRLETLHELASHGRRKAANGHTRITP